MVCFFDRIARSKFNKRMKKITSICLLSLLSIFAACGDDPDITPPTIANDTITLTENTGTTIRVSWKKAKDETSPTDKLKYLVVLSKSNNINTVEKAEANTILPDLIYRTDVTSQVIDVEPGEEYRASVIVKDEKENKTLYEVVFFTIQN